MKKSIIATIALLSFNSFAACKVALNINLFSRPFANIENSKQLKKIKKTLKGLGHQVVSTEEATYFIDIDTGVEKTYEAKDIQISDIKITKTSNNEVVFHDIKSRKISTDRILDTKHLLKFTKRHISKKFPLCH